MAVTLMFLKENSEMMQEMKKQDMEFKKKEIELQDKTTMIFLELCLPSNSSNSGNKTFKP